jgi:hypothetical protein
MNIETQAKQFEQANRIRSVRHNVGDDARVCASQFYDIGFEGKITESAPDDSYVIVQSDLGEECVVPNEVGLFVVTKRNNQETPMNAVIDQVVEATETEEAVNETVVETAEAVEVPVPAKKAAKPAAVKKVTKTARAIEFVRANDPTRSEFIEFAQKELGYDSVRAASTYFYRAKSLIAAADAAEDAVEA